MVAAVTTERARREQWTIETLENAGMPGAEADHRWIARNVTRALDPLGPDADHVLPAVLSGLLLEMGEDPSRSSELRGRWFPIAWVESTPALLRSGFPLSAWLLVKGGLLRFEKTKGSSVGRWRIEAGRARESLVDWYEMGEHLLLRNLALALKPLLLEGPDVTMALAELPPDIGRRWIRGLRKEWEAMGVPHPPVLIRV